MTVVALDDTDSRTQGMCTTYAATLVAEQIEAAGGQVDRLLLVRLNPAIERKTRGNAALAVHTDLDAERTFALARECLSEFAIDGERTSPGLVVADSTPDAVPDDVASFATAALRERHTLETAIDLLDEHGWRHAAITPEDTTATDAAGYGRIGALAAIGAWRAHNEWTYEHIAYREFDRCGTPREVDEGSVFAAAETGSPTVWDTVDRVEREAVCVPNAPGPILYGIRGDDPDACRQVAAQIEGEPVDRERTFVTNQGTDAHIAPGEIGSLREGAGYQVEGVVATPPETRRGGHVFFELSASGSGGAGDDPRLTCAAFEPTKRFRDVVRSLRVGDAITAVGEHGGGTIKLEKLRVRDLVRTEQTTPTCPDCGRSMSSAGRNQGYRCRDCGTNTDSKATRRLDRTLDRGWYEVPPYARRHLAKPLVRGGFDGPTHPEQ